MLAQSRSKMRQFGKRTRPRSCVAVRKAVSATYVYDGMTGARGRIAGRASSCGARCAFDFRPRPLQGGLPTAPPLETGAVGYHEVRYQSVVGAVGRFISDR